MTTSNRFPTLNDFNDDVLDVHGGSSHTDCQRLGDYRLVQVSCLIERLRLEQEAGAAGRIRQEALLSGMEALLMDAYLMYTRAHHQCGGKA
ncbi:hypothetical protein [Metapseudomonas resinovorans]|uniref:Uncharacterized protein n=1 Tax=Metapseudomonas resinovorans NBRC 106553 TaxID=1245471 RepID=S6BKN7_METRE|nr:hypothetical protein [Pseudomonas resinovorans]BAN49819.1 hypothetical protein PCA10_40870 [Pseudomonas resinovorans NBRC 106553]